MATPRYGPLTIKFNPTRDRWEAFCDGAIRFSSDAVDACSRLIDMAGNRFASVTIDRTELDAYIAERRVS